MSAILEAAGIKARTKGISKKFQSIQISPIKQMPILAREIPDNISLAWGIPSFTTPDHIRRAAAEGVMNEPKLSFYSPSYGLPEFQRAAADRLMSDYGIKIDAKNEILIAPGAMAGLMGSLATILDDGDEVLIPSPSFPSYTDQTKVNGGLPVYIPLDENDNFRLHAGEVEKRITSKTKAIILCNPNNPTGTVQTEETIRKIGELALKHNFWVISDDPYVYSIFDGRKYFSPAEIPELKENLIVLRSLSKEYAITGWRVCIMYAEAGFLREYLKFSDNCVISTNTIAQWGCIEALQGPQECVKEHLEELDRRRHLMMERVKRLPDLLEAQMPEGTYYMFPKLLPKMDDISFAIQLLKEAKVQVVPGSGFGPTAAGHIRLCFGYDEETIHKAFDRIESWWEKAKQELL